MEINMEASQYLVYYGSFIAIICHQSPIDTPPSIASMTSLSIHDYIYMQTGMRLICEHIIAYSMNI